MSLRRILYSNSLVIAMFTIFLASIVGMSFAGWRSNNQANAEHAASVQTYTEYIVGGDFIEGVFENWESEFLQMWALVVLTVWLRQKGSSDSKPMRGRAPVDTLSRYSIINSTSWKKRFRALGHTIYAHSLGASLFVLFLISFSLHAVGGVAAFNEQNAQHNQSPMSARHYITTSHFWYESLQNWQSEFLAIGTLLVLSIKLRERGSPESKPIGTRYDRHTGD
ncbi:MAG TPA: DUF6766 family protein [Candidatus Saccharimonadales bacterium]|nr:DUF6766 family protein [Candidatus Saccharimonadales bacterium]